MKRNYYLLIAMLMAFLTPLSMNAFGTSPTGNIGTEKRLFAGCDGVTVTGGSGSITVAGLGAYSHIQVFTPDFASQVFNQEITTSTLTVPITAAGNYLVKVWSNPNPGEFCENNFPVTVGGGGSTLTLNGCNNASGTAAAGATTTIVNYSIPTATTTCAAGGATVTRTSGGASGTAFPIGTSQVCFSATDACGNTKTCCITITVTGSASSTLTLNGCNNASATAAAGATSAVVTYTTPTATTTCAAGGATVTRTSGGASGTAFPVGTSQVCFSASDACGNTKTCCISITVTAGGGGGGSCIEYPLADANDCIGGSWQPYSLFVAGTLYRVKDGKFRKNADGTATLTANYTTDGWSVIGTANVTFTGMTMTAGVGSPKFSTCTQGASAAGWMYYTSFSGTLVLNGVTRTVAPRGEAFQVGVGANYQNSGDLGGSGWFTLSDGALGDFNFRLGVGVSCGGANPCLTDAVPPTFTSCPANINLTTTTNCANASWTAPTATDNCGTPTVTQTAGPTNGSCLAPGSYGVTYKATDAKGNVATCSFTITVNAFLNCNNVTGNTIAKSCVNNVPSLMGSAFTGYQYIWLSSTSGCPTQSSQAIAGATGQHYALPSRVTTTTYFVRCARPVGCTTWAAVNESNCITVYASDCASTVCNAPSTPSGWMYLGVFGTSHYFKYTLSGDLTCTDARSKVQAIGGRLPVIKTSAQNAFIQSKLGSGNAWVGLRRSGNSNTWLWDNNAVATYYNWASGEPNDYNGNEDCVQIRPDDAWNDVATHAYNWCIAEIPCSGVGAYLVTHDVLDMSAAAELSRTRVEWVNNTGYKNDFFTVEKANATTGDFEKLETVNNKYGNDLNEHYAVYDNNPTEGDNTYRLTVNYVDGTLKVSDVKTVNYKDLDGVRVFPNPATDIIGVDLSKYKGKAVSIYLYNQFGQQVLTHQVEKVNGEAVNLDVSQNQAGNYLIRVTSKGRKDVVRQVHIAK